MNDIRIGTCSWKYDSWKGLVYSQNKGINFLREYSKQYNTVEIDQWFWSLFKGNTVSLPKASTVCEYAASIPEGFLFTIKIPNSITLTHHYRTGKNEPLVVNPYFLSVDVMKKFLETLEPLIKHLGPLMFQFEYLNKMKMPNLTMFQERFGEFLHELPGEYQYGIEIRNPNYLTKEYFSFLKQENLGHVFLQGYYMPSIFDIYEKFKELLISPIVIRLHGGDRKDIEDKTGNRWEEVFKVLCHGFMFPKVTSDGSGS